MSRKQNKGIVPFQPYESTSKNGIERGYIRYTASQLYSDAVLDLSHSAFRFFTYMKVCAKGHSQVIYGHKQAEHDLGISRQTYINIVKELTSKKLIKKLPRSAYAPSRYEFIEDWKKYSSQQRDVFTGERKIKKKQNSNLKNNKCI